GGVILDLIHEIDYTRWLLGGDEIQEVFCYSSKFSKLNIETEDIAEILMRTKKAIISINLDYLQHPSTRTCQIIGTKGKAVLNIQANTGKVYDNYGGITEFHPNSYFEINFTYQDELKYFFDCVKKKKRTIVDITEGKRILELALAAKKSVILSKPIKVKNNLLTLDIK
ncbi:MAG: Gfo/Idh/MocA family oxidoreductase, partial [Nanoarchaeota archaeon]